jgi:hypothetical protein
MNPLLDGHYRESCELTKEMIVHRKSAICTGSMESIRFRELQVLLPSVVFV